MRRFMTASGVLLASVGAMATAPAPPASAAHDHVHRAAYRRGLAHYTSEIGRLRRETWYWQRVMGVRRTPIHTRTLAVSSVVRLRRVAAFWRRRAYVAARKGHHPPRLDAWLCIHRYEGRWRDPGAPYYGGLQMDISFQRRYGGWLLRRKGTADHWTPLEQIWTAVRAERERGFYPWPNTARFCGLI